MADKGLYSYDIDTYIGPGLAYHRVAVPLNRMAVDELPGHVQAIVRWTKLGRISFEQSSRIEYEPTLDA